MEYDAPAHRNPRFVYLPILTVFFLLFCFRVSAQLIQAWCPVDFLPPFDSWESGAVPYWLLCVSQAVIILVCARVMWRLYVGVTVPSARTGRVLLVLGWIYFGLMCVRLIIGLTVLPEHFWFGARLPTLFHLVLACFVLVYGRFHTASDRGAGASHLGGVA